MANWRPQHFRAEAFGKGISNDVLLAAELAGQQVVAVDPALPPVFTLRHLAHLAEVDYGVLRNIAARRLEDPYRIFRIRKRPGKDGRKRFRVICVPDPALMTVQRWLSKNVLSRARVHSASTAYSPDSKLIDAASPHCGCRWLIKVDIQNFFESVSEIAAYNAFLSLGYQPLVSFEMARLSTRLGNRTYRRTHDQWNRRPEKWGYKINDYVLGRIGHLPQGAPTSPMIANIAMRDADVALTELAQRAGLIYTRYADDLTFSTRNIEFTRLQAVKVIGLVYKILGKFGFAPNTSKTQVVPPRARKIVLGLLVDQSAPRLPREFKNMTRMHLYYLRRPGLGPVQHAANRGFSAVAGLKNHLFGLAAFAAQIEPDFGSALLTDLKGIPWPI